MIKTFTVSVLALAAIASPAAAQDDGTFSGFRVEVIGGLDKVAISADEDTFGSDAGGSEEGILYGIGVGYDVELGGAVVGLEAEYADATTDYSLTLSEEIEGYELDGTATLDAGQDLYIGVRAGVPYGSNLLFYAKGGYTMAAADLNVRGTVDGETGTINADLDLSGFRIGAGVEGRIHQHAFVKVEYRYSSYRDGELEVEGVSLDAEDAFDYIDLNRHQVVFGVGYRF